MSDRLEHLLGESGAIEVETFGEEIEGLEREYRAIENHGSELLEVARGERDQLLAENRAADGAI